MIEEILNLFDKIKVDVF